jgi:transposase InsO family protein
MDSYVTSERRYGSLSITKELRGRGERIGRRTVMRLMRTEGLRGKARKRRFEPTTNSEHAFPIAKNLLNRNFTASSPNERWVADTTELRLGASGRIFLAVLMDLHSRFIVGWALSKVNDRHLTIAALQAATERRRPSRGLIHHSDRGSTYASSDYQTVLQDNGFICSMSRTGDCFDNAAMESWFSTLKRELDERFDDEDTARSHLFTYIECFYNQRRLHSANNFRSPADHERLFQEQQSARTVPTISASRGKGDSRLAPSRIVKQQTRPDHGALSSYSM